MDTSPLLYAQEGPAEVSMDEITAEMDSYLSKSGHRPSSTSKLSAEDLSAPGLPETPEAHMADRVWEIASKIVEKTSYNKNGSIMEDPLKLDTVLDRIERHVKFSEEEVQTSSSRRKFYRKTPRRTKKFSDSYMSPTFSSFQNANETASERLGALREAKRGAEQKRNQMALEKVKIERVYDRTLNELEESKKEQQSIKKELFVKRNQVDALKHENETLRDQMRKSFNGSEKWKQKALEVTKSLQKHVKKVTFENVQLKEKVSLLDNSSTEIKKYSKEVTALSSKIANLQLKNKTALLEKETIEEKLATEQKERSHTRYLLQLEKKNVIEATEKLENLQAKHKNLNKAYNDQAQELLARTSEMRAESDVLQGQLKRFQLRLKKS